MSYLCESLGVSRDSASPHMRDNPTLYNPMLYMLSGTHSEKHGYIDSLAQSVRSDIPCLGHTLNISTVTFISPCCKYDDMWDGSRMWSVLAADSMCDPSSERHCE